MEEFQRTLKPYRTNCDDVYYFKFEAFDNYKCLYKLHLIFKNIFVYVSKDHLSFLLKHV